MKGVYNNKYNNKICTKAFLKNRLIHVFNEEIIF